MNSDLITYVQQSHQQESDLFYDRIQSRKLKQDLRDASGEPRLLKQPVQSIKYDSMNMFFQQSTDDVTFMAGR